MISLGPVVLVLFLFALGALLQSIRTYRRYRRIAAILSNTNSGSGDGEATTVRGRISVTEPATLQREPPEEAAIDRERPALVAWRIGRRVNTGGNRGGSRWNTTDGGIAAGQFAVRHDGQYVRVPGDELSTEPDDAVDPFELSTLHLGDPDVDIRLGEPGPVRQLLERIRLIGEDGLVNDVEITTSIGSKSLTPERYQAVWVGDGDEIAIDGTVTETALDSTLELDDDPSIVIGDNLQRKADQIRFRALEQVGLGVAILLGIGLLGVIL